MRVRQDFELPPCFTKWGWQFHHLGIPTTKICENERFIPHLGMYVSGFPDSPYGIEWMRFAADSSIHPLIQKVPHLAFVVKDLTEALKGKNILHPPSKPSGGLMVAMIEHNGAPIELMEFYDQK